jgi:hypothetical protein
VFDGVRFAGGEVMMIDGVPLVCPFTIQKTLSNLSEQVEIQLNGEIGVKLIKLRDFEEIKNCKYKLK